MPKPEARTMLVIKGTLGEAYEIAKARGINIDDQRAVGPDYTTVVAFTTASYDAIAKWFGESPNNAPYPVGTLLFFMLGKGGKHG